MASADGFELLRTALENAGVRYAVGGSWASTAFGDPRFTNDVDVLVDLTNANVGAFLGNLPPEFYFDEEEAREAVRRGRSFNLIHMPSVLKFDLFPAAAFPLGRRELDRAVLLKGSGLSEGAAWFVTPEDILLAKLHWYRLGGEVSEVQWRDIQGIVRSRGSTMDSNYLHEGAETLGVVALLKRALSSV